MFRAIAEKCAKGVANQDDYLIPVSSIAGGRDLKLLQIVVKLKKRHCIFWEKVKFRPYNFELVDVLLNPHIPMRVHENIKEGFCKWQKNIELSLRGKFGVDILEELGDVNVKDTIKLDANLGQLDRVELDSSSLEKEISKRRINLCHVLIEQIRRNKKSVLCVVQSIIQLAQDAEVKRTDDIGGGVDVSVRFPVCCMKGNHENSVHGSGSVEDNSIGDIGLLKGQPIAYKVWELQVDKYGGEIVPCIAGGTHGGFMNKEDIIGGPLQPASTIDGGHLETDGLEPYNPSGPVDSPDKVCQILQPLLSMSGEQRRKIKELLYNASAADFETLDILFDQVENRFHDTRTDEKLFLHGISDLKFKNQKICCDFLTVAGFELKYDEDKMLSPAEFTPEFKACCHLMEAMADLPEEVMLLIRRCVSELHPTLLHVIEQFLKGKPMVEFTRYVEELARDPVGMEILNTLRIEVDMERKNPLIARDRRLADCVDELYWWLCAIHVPDI